MMGNKYTHTAIRKWLLVVCNILILACASTRIYAEERGIGGGYVEDPVITVPGNAYTTFSMVYNGKRYYLGIDTAQAKSGKDTIAVYDAPCYAAMWIAGPMWSPTGAILPNKDYTRTVKSVWIKERCSRDKYLSVGPEKKNYSPLILTDTVNATMWHTAKDMTVQSQYMHGYTYAYSDESGVETYRYLAYDPVYGFSRLYEPRPMVSQRISVWDRKTGRDVTCTFTPSTYTFGLNTTQEMVKQPITSQVQYYTNVDRFRSRFDQMDIYVTRSTPIIDQSALVEAPYEMYGYYEWASNPRATTPTKAEILDGDKSYNGYSMMKHYGITINKHGFPEDTSKWTLDPDTVKSQMMQVLYGKFTRDDEKELWYDTIYAPGYSLFDIHEAVKVGAEWTPGDYKDHNDWLRQHFWIKACADCAYEHFVDSIRLVRETFHNHPFTTLTSSSSPNDYVFPYTYDDKLSDGTTPIPTADGYLEKTFTISARYKDGNDILHSNNALESSTTGEERDLDIANLACYRDTIWTSDPTPAVDHIVLYDTLIVEALLADGTTTAIWSEGHDERWIESITLTARNEIKVRVKQYNPEGNENRIAQLRYTYRYWHSSAEDDWSETKRSIWITQKTKTADNSELYEFHHAAGKGNTESPTDLQPVHEKNYVMYAIPGEEMELALHSDHWGYYRWFSYNPGGSNHDKDPMYGSTWSWVEKPKNHLTDANANEFMPINPSLDPSSRGQWDMSMGDPNHFTVNLSTPTPTINYPASSTKTGIIACDVSAYTDIDKSGEIGTSLSSLTEPTLSYRNLFDIRPAKEQADKMATCRTGGNWMEEHEVIVPAQRPFTLQQQYPTSDAASYVVEDLLQYIYYFRPTGTPADADMGTDPGSNYDQTATYGRVGKTYYAGLGKRKAKLLTFNDIKKMGNGTRKNIVIVSAYKGSRGYVLGESGEDPIYWQYADSVTTVTKLKNFVERFILNPTTQSSYTMSLKKTANTEDQATIQIYKEGESYPLMYFYGYHNSAVPLSFLAWIRGTGNVDGTRDITLKATSASSDGDRITGGDTATMSMYMSFKWGINYKGYWTACDVNWRGKYSNEFQISEEEGSAANRVWFLFEIKEPEELPHTETPVWYKSTDGTTWTDTVAWTGGHDAGYTLLPDGHLHINENVLRSINTTTWYALKTDHFQLAKFKVTTRDADTEGPTNEAIISEENILNQYDILHELGTAMYGIPAPRTSAVVSPYHHMPWSYCELSYHYPRTSAAPGSGGTHFIADANRIYDTDLPAKGEYCYINKFDNGKGDVVACMEGAENGYMLCLNAAFKPTTFFNFEYPQLPCSDQELYLTANMCNPVENSYNPQITADLEGWDGAKWVPIYRFKTGEIPYNAERRWYQMVLPIDRAKIKDYEKFRCTASMPGTTEKDAFLLIDRVRFIAKVRPVSVFQNKATCLDSESGGLVDIVARLDYKHASYPSGTLIAFQYQKKVGSSFVALNPVKDGITYINEAVGPEGVTVAKGTTDTCGVIRIPASDYVPSKAKGDSITTVDHVTDTTKCYVNEGTAGSAYYVMYLSQKINAVPSDTFRVVMAGMLNASDQPTISGDGCATERIIAIQNPVELHVSGYTGVWPNTTREDMTGADAAHTLRTANATYTVTASIADGFLPKDATSGSGKCMFDVVRTTVDDRNYAATDVWFKNRFGCTRQQFREVMTIFRADDERNEVRMETNWNNVRPEHFRYDGRSQAQADSIYAILNRLIVEKGLLQIGLSSYDIYLSSNNNSYAVLWPIPASGTYVKSGVTYPILVCSTPRWFEIHSDASTYNLRFGYDNLQEGNYYMTPVIRASVTEANTALKVRIADITHADHAGVVIGWDSTHVVESNDPTWNSTKSFRYHQDRIVQDTLFKSYYHVTDTAPNDQHRYVTFTPVDAAYIARLQANTCACYDYDAGKSTYDTDAETGVFTQKAASGCNEWHVKTTAGYQTANNFTLRAGYWYKFRTAFFDVSSVIAYNAGGDGECRGHSEFILAVAPDTVRWTPSHNESANYWNDDNNWTPVMASTPADGFKATVPMGNTKVIIPQVGEGMLPIVAETVVEQKDTLDFGYTKNTCEKILFKPNAQMLGQEKLTYTNAFVDVHFTTGQWQTFSPALDDIYAGDMYIPYATTYNPSPGYESTGASIDTVDFETKPFPYKDNYAGTYNPREYPFAFYQGFYNASVPVPFYNTDTNDSTLTNTDSIKSKNTVDWIRTPSMRMHYKPGAPCVVMGYDATDEDGRDIVVRLPKTETQYYGYGKVAENRYISGMAETLPARSTVRNLAYDKYAPSFNESTGISYTLNNATESDLFFFGNPTMALVDVYKLCVANETVLKHEDGKYFFTAYQLMDGSSYTTKTISGPGQYFIAPQRAIGLVAKEVSSSLTIQLKPSALVAITGEGIIVNSSDIVAPTPAPKRIARTKSVYEEPDTKWLYITASNETNWGVKKSYLTLGEQAGANRGYSFGEDALSIASGLNYYDDASYATPLSLYTIADNQALMQDVRDTLSRVPLIFTTLPDYSYDDYTILSFSMNGEWNQPLYLYDALTNDSILIRNGLQVAVRTPNSDQIRYFINGTYTPAQNTTEPSVPTGTEELTNEGMNELTNSGTIIYDMLGRRIMTLNEFDLISNIQLPTGVYIIQSRNKTERMVIR